MSPTPPLVPQARTVLSPPGSTTALAGSHAFAWATLAIPPTSVVLTFESGHEPQAFFLGSMIADLLRTGIHVAEPGGAASVSRHTRLRLHVGDRPPAVDDDTPCLHLRPAVNELATTVHLGDPLYGSFGPLHFPRLGWAETPFHGSIIVDSDQGPICTRRGRRLTMHADLSTLYGHEVLRHSMAASDVSSILRALHVVRFVLAQVVAIPLSAERAISLLTVDAEDQQRYFINRLGVCSNISGAGSDDLQFARSCRTIMDRCEAFDLKAIFMIPGDQLDASFVDAFGDRLIGLDDNRSVLTEISTRGHDIGCHGFDHEWWISKGVSATPAMNMRQKLSYFVETSGDLRMLAGLAMLLLRYRVDLRAARAKKRARETSIGEGFTSEEVASDVARWRALVGHADDQLFIRYPGFVRSAETINSLDASFAAVVDSSDVYDPVEPLPILPYRLLGVRHGQVYRSRIVEIPCLFVDKVLRTRDQNRVEAYLDRVKACARMPGSVVSLVTHTKVLGAAWGHCHAYLHDPFRGMALPMIRESFERFARVLRERTLSRNWRELRTMLFGVTP